MHKIIKVEVLNGYKVKLEYEDGQKGIADLSHLVGKGWIGWVGWRQV